jgi:membrane protein DedA with SNARE-associated domain
VSELIARLDQFPAVTIYLVAAVLVFAETGLVIGVALPGEVTLLLVGFLSYSGPLRPLPAVVVMAVAAVTGDSVAYVEGRHVGPHLQASGLGRWVGEPRWERAATLLRRYGGRAVMLARFVAVVRTLVPRLAAIAGLRYRQVLGWDVLGVTTQVSVSVAVGYLAGESYQRAATIFSQATGAALLLVLVVVALVLFGRYLGRHPDPVAVFGARLGRWRPLQMLNNAYLASFRWLIVRVGVGGAVAVNVVLGVWVLLLLGVALAWTTSHLVVSSGFPLIDPLVGRWMASQQTPGLTSGARLTLSVLRGSYLVVFAGLVGLVLNRRPERWRADLLGVLGTVGAFIPLVILALAADWAGVPSAGEPGFFANQASLATASLGLIAWFVTRWQRGWTVAVSAWMLACGLVVLICGARLYLGLSMPSELAASVLLGGLWVIIFAVAWRTRDRVRAEGDETGLVR